MKKIILTAILILSGISVSAKECITGYACSIEEPNKKSSVQKEQSVNKIQKKETSKEKVETTKKSVKKPNHPTK